MGKDAKKAAVSDEWRSKDVEERLSYSLIKVPENIHHVLELNLKHISLLNSN